MSNSILPTRCAVIGLGMGGNHARTLHAFADADLVAVADLDQARLDSWAETIGQDRVFLQYEDMLKAAQPEVVIIALPNFLHLPVTKTALEAGCHVLCEKPMAMTVEQAEEMNAIATATGKTLGINFSQRFSPDHRAMEAIARSGDLGEIYHGYCSWTRRDGFPRFGGWFGQQQYSGGGPLIDLGVHRIDRSMSLMGYPTVQSVSGATHHKIGVPRAQQQGLQFDVEDFASGFVRFTNGASLVFEVSWGGHQGPKERQLMHIQGTDGALESGPNGAFHHYRRDDVFLTAAINCEAMQARKSVEEFVHCIREGLPFVGQPEHGIQVQRILNGLYDSAETGREVVYE